MNSSLDIVAQPVYVLERSNSDGPAASEQGDHTLTTSSAGAAASPDRSALLARTATAPISWGVCEVPGWGHQLTPDRVLAEMVELGFTHTELGSAGWLPETVDDLTPVLDHHGLSLLASFVPLVLHDPAQADEMLDQAVHHASLLAAMGAVLK